MDTTTRDPLGALLTRLAAEQSDALALVDAALLGRGWSVEVVVARGTDPAERLHGFVIALEDSTGAQFAARTVWAPAGSVPLGRSTTLSALGDRVAREVAQAFARVLPAD